MNKSSLLPKFAIEKPVTISVSFLAILVIGFIAFQQIPIELLPTGFRAPFLGVWVPYRNANPREIEEQIARPVEEEVRTVNGVKTVRSFSHTDGCWIGLEFVQGTDMDFAYDQLRDRMERVRPLLPDDLDRYYLRKFGQDDEPVIMLSISIPQSVEDPYYLVEHHIKRPIERIDGVANIEVWGAFEKVIQILVNQDKVDAYGVNLFETIQKLRQDNFAISSGWVKEGEKKFLVRSLGRFQDLEDIRRIPLNQTGLTIGQVADVTYDVPERNWQQRVNRQPSIKLAIYKESLANTVALSHQLKEILENEINRLPILRGAEINLLFVQGDLIEESIRNLIDTALWGGFFALLVIFFFLRRIRMTIIMTLAIPLSILISLTITYFIGWTLNTVTMMGLMVSVGMVVDNAIVVLENIYRKRNEGFKPKEASVIGASEVSLAVTMATLTTIVVFLPILLIDDSFFFYLRRVGIPVIFALLASLFVALVLIPLTTTRMISDKPVPEIPIVVWNRKLYQRVLSFVLDHRIDAMIVLLVLMYVTFFVLAPKVPSSDAAPGNISDLNLIFDMPSNYVVDETDAFFKEVEDTLFTYAKKYRIKAVDTGFRKTFGRVRVFLEASERDQWYDNIYRTIRAVIGFPLIKDLTSDEILTDLKPRLPTRPGIRFRTSWRGSSQEDEGSVSIMIYGDDTDRLERLADEAARRMRLIEGVISVDTDQEIGGDEIKVVMNRNIAQRNGINPDQVAYTIMYAVRGIMLPRFYASDKEIEMRIQLQEEDRENLGQLKNITFINRNGKPVPLSSLAKFNLEKSFGEIARTDGKTYLEVKAKTPMNNLQKMSQQIDEIMQDFQLPYGYSWEKGSRFWRMREQDDSFKNAMLIAVIFVFLLMGVLFESFVLPLSVLVAIPLSLFGAYLALFLTETSQDLMAGIGMIILIGVVVNNAIVLIDMINRRRNEGIKRKVAILEAGGLRFRPILMTSFTTIGGLLPMALGNAALIGAPYAPMGITLIGGLFTSTALTLLAVPVLYTLFDDMSLFFRRILGWFKKPVEGESLAVDSVENL
ncbi:MAG: efflux RND transporter permease subunit [bacterium]|nr:MAG: efflux RND transporter permease subunit [bacterium]